MIPRIATVQLPWPPSVNRYWRSVVMGGSPRVLLSKEGRTYRLDVQAALLKAFGIIRPINSRLNVSIMAYPPNRIRRDLDNLLKGPLDALTASGVWSDDSQVDRLTIERGPVRKPGVLLVTIEARPDAPVQRELI